MFSTTIKFIEKKYEFVKGSDLNNSIFIMSYNSNDLSENIFFITNTAERLYSYHWQYYFY